MKEEPQIQIKNITKRERRLKKKKKKQKKNYMKKIKTMNKALTTKLLLNQDEDMGLIEGTTKYITPAMTLHRSLQAKERILYEKEYQKLFRVISKTKIMDEIKIDEMIEEYNEKEDFSLD